MSDYEIVHYETRIAEDETDDVAIFKVVEIGPESTPRQSWEVAVILSPLFRVLQMDMLAPKESRAEMVAGLGAQAIVSQLQAGQAPPFDGPIVLSVDYPGAPGDPQTLSAYHHIRVSDGQIQIRGD